MSAFVQQWWTISSQNMGAYGQQWLTIFSQNMGAFVQQWRTISSQNMGAFAQQWWVCLHRRYNQPQSQFQQTHAEIFAPTFPPTLLEFVDDGSEEVGAKEAVEHRRCRGG